MHAASASQLPTTPHGVRSHKGIDMRAPMHSHIPNTECMHSHIASPECDRTHRAVLAATGHGWASWRARWLGNRSPAPSLRSFPQSQVRGGCVM
eukprot:114883-Chlamydomonas_euryale.AAC.1